MDFEAEQMREFCNSYRTCLHEKTILEKNAKQCTTSIELEE